MSHAFSLADTEAEIVSVNALTYVGPASLGETLDQSCQRLEQVPQCLDVSRRPQMRYLRKLLVGCLHLCWPINKDLESENILRLS